MHVDGELNIKSKVYFILAAVTLISAGCLTWAYMDSVTSVGADDLWTLKKYSTELENQSFNKAVSVAFSDELITVSEFRTLSELYMEIKMERDKERATASLKEQIQ